MDAGFGVQVSAFDWLFDAQAAHLIGCTPKLFAKYYGIQEITTTKEASAIRKALWEE